MSIAPKYVYDSTRSINWPRYKKGLVGCDSFDSVVGEVLKIIILVFPKLNGRDLAYNKIPLAHLGLCRP